MIIGGTSGIGFGVAKACVEHGASVVVAGRSQQKVDSAIERLKPAADDLSKVRGMFATCLDTMLKPMSKNYSILPQTTARSRYTTLLALLGKCHHHWL
jgi:NAD(P)-dependent dehydrogenase (short-subunit alcohol dehydrogenase family)